VALGGLVRATGSGLGCTGWPKCSATRWFPPLQYHALIEYSHRFTAFVDILLVALLAVVAWRRYRDAPRVVGSCMAAAGLIVVQAVLGGIVVKGDLAALLVTAHFAAAMVLTGCLVYATVASFTIEARPSATVEALTVAARAVAAAVFALLVVGTYVRGQNAGLAFGDWPLMGGRLIPSVAHLPEALMFAHRALAAVVAVLVASFAVWAWRERRRQPAVAVLALSAAALFSAQILIGAALVWSRLGAPARVAHVTVSSLIWGALVAAAATARVMLPTGPKRGAGVAAIDARTEDVA